MGDESAPPMKGKPSGKDTSKEPKREKLSVSAILPPSDEEHWNRDRRQQGEG